MPKNSPQENNIELPITINLMGSSVEVLAPYNPNNSDVDQYVPSIDFRRNAHRRVEQIANNLSGFFSLYNLWIKGTTDCDYTVVMEMTMRAGVISSQFNNLAKECRKDRDIPDQQGLTLDEQLELIKLSKELGVSPSETIALIRKGMKKVIQ